MPAGQAGLAAGQVAAFGGLNAYLWKRTGKDRIPVIVYSAALLAMSLTALDCGPPKTAAGGALFLVSDALLALEKFGGVHLPANESLVMATYAGAQALLAGDGGRGDRGGEASAGSGDDPGGGAPRTEAHPIVAL